MSLNQTIALLCFRRHNKTAGQIFGLHLTCNHDMCTSLASNGFYLAIAIFFHCLQGLNTLRYHQ